MLQARDQLQRLLRNNHDRNAAPLPDADERLLWAIFTAYPDRLARRRSPNDPRAKMIGGRGVKLAPQSAVVDEELFVCVDVEAGGAESFVRMASGVERDWLPSDRLLTVNEVTFDSASGKLVARKQLRFADLVIDDTAGHIADEEQAAQVLTAACLERLEQVLPAADSPAGMFRTRIQCLKQWLPDADLPSFADAELGELVHQLCRGRRSLADVRNGPWLDVMRGMLSYQQLQLLEREAPEKWEVPTGSAITIQYELGRPPILAVRIQEVFGLTETPRLASGRVKMLLHLLAPNYRPQQVTDDLASFWKNGYPIVRKELRARYPKHSWPEDPLTAEAIRGPRKREQQ